MQTTTRRTVERADHRSRTVGPTSWRHPVLLQNPQAVVWRCSPDRQFELSTIDLPKVSRDPDRTP